MDSEDIRYFKDYLEKRKNEIIGTIESMKGNGEGEQNKFTPGEISNYDNHFAEIATELFQVEFNNGLVVHEENLLRDIDDALAKIKKGGFGKCEFCAEDIDIERLKILPYAKLCIRCEKEKPNVTVYQRPVEEKVIDAAFGRKYLNKREDDEHEGLDIINDLIKCGNADGPQDMGGYHDYEEFYTNEIDEQGIVDDMDRISNEQYKRQLP